jgi:hypothetical protein
MQCPRRPVRKLLFPALKFGDRERLRHIASPRSGPPRFYITRQPLQRLGNLLHLPMIFPNTPLVCLMLLHQRSDLENLRRK